jgi:hypothetical protein
MNPEQAEEEEEVKRRWRSTLPKLKKKVPFLLERCP